LVTRDSAEPVIQRGVFALPPTPGLGNIGGSDRRELSQNKLAWTTQWTAWQNHQYYWTALIAAAAEALRQFIRYLNNP